MAGLGAREGLVMWVVPESEIAGLMTPEAAFDAVEAVFAGPAGQVDDMVEACRRGPKHARVAGVAVAPAGYPSVDGFEQRATY